MQRILNLLIAALAFLALSATTIRADEVNEMMLPSARVYTEPGSGSATAIKVDPIIGTYLITNYHVIEGQLDTIEVQFYQEDERHPAYVHSIDVQNDIAVIITQYKHEHIASLGRPPDLFDEVYCIGGSLGMPVAPSRGIITGVNVKLFGTRYFTRMDCDIAPGNSGGGLFVFQGGQWRLVGMPVLVKAVNVGFTSIPITFLGASVRIEDIRRHLYHNNVIRVPPQLVGNSP